MVDIIVKTLIVKGILTHLLLKEDQNKHTNECCIIVTLIPIYPAIYYQEHS